MKYKILLILNFINEKDYNTLILWRKYLKTEEFIPSLLEGYKRKSNKKK